MFKAAHQSDKPVAKPKKRKPFKISGIFKFLSSKKMLLIDGLIFMVMLIILGLLFFYLLPISRINQATSSLSRSQFTDQDLMDWSEVMKNSRIISGSAIGSMQSNQIMNYLDGYQQYYPEFNKNYPIKLLPISWENYTESQRNLNDPSGATDNQFPLNFSYEGVVGTYEFERISEFNLIVNDIRSPKLSQVIAHNTLENYRSNITGTATTADVDRYLTTGFDDLAGALKDQDQERFLNRIKPEEKDDFGKILLISNLSSKLDSLKTAATDLKITDLGEFVELGKMQLLQNSSGFTTNFEIYYRKADKIYFFGNVFGALGVVPVPSEAVKATVQNTASNTNTEIILSCQDCWLAPVTKINALPSSYVPGVTNTGLTGGGQVTAVTRTALQEMNSDADSQGIKITVISSYRSYQTQVSTFNYWVNREIAAGLSRSQAEIKANTYSARPGHSEHQLGTTVDLKCTGCGDFDNSANNLKLYDYLAANCYKFGFAISYPKNSLDLTGYKYEPWHIRFIGKDQALEFFNTGYLDGNGNYLAKFLETKHLY